MFLPDSTDMVGWVHPIMKSFLAMASQIIAFTLSLHLLAATGFAATVPVRHKHRRVSGAHPAAAARRPVKAPAKRLVRPAVSVAPRAPVRVMAVQAQKAAVAGPRLAAVVPAPAIIAGGPRSEERRVGKESR